ncbi:prepilin-type N-terminal cleavage/methylation domain-containing protein [Campylobacter sp. FMV-PI01]|uniref:Prepilin-type N-terminal cleavage/methylation domain-containing protein n=1 Tax=Campylobacter portucalensis TaxID=2608384 RepID=A0A6L5WJ42_9BACT|nr:prepilin-type N-terminal cleavage/methylation domain-containing protein [Campylobacter portucalensis]MSN96025.1 prepilin-type N-terminal cleavage/methylation domain-containing protein [Campylobacter portucalensis]
MKKAFTMIELIFVIVILGILAGIGIPKLAVTRDDAMIAKLRADIASIRSGIAHEKGRHMIEANMTGWNTKFKLEDNFSNVLEMKILLKKPGETGWSKSSTNEWKACYRKNNCATFEFDSDKNFVCKDNCKYFE